MPSHTNAASRLQRNPDEDEFTGGSMHTSGTPLGCSMTSMISEKLVGCCCVTFCCCAYCTAFAADTAASWWAVRRRAQERQARTMRRQAQCRPLCTLFQLWNELSLCVLLLADAGSLDLQTRTHTIKCGGTFEWAKDNHLHLQTTVHPSPQP